MITEFLPGVQFHHYLIATDGVIVGGPFDNQYEAEVHKRILCSGG